MEANKTAAPGTSIIFVNVLIIQYTFSWQDLVVWDMIRILEYYIIYLLFNKIYKMVHSWNVFKCF